MAIKSIKPNKIQENYWGRSWDVDKL